MRFILLLFPLLFISCSDKPIVIDYVSDIDVSNISIRALHVEDEDHIFFSASNSTFGYTTDGGENWQLKKIDTLNQEFRSIYVVENNIFVVNIGSPTKVLKSEDYGTTWQTTYTDTSKIAFYNSIKFWDNDNGIISGDPQQEGYLSLLITKDGGEHWLKIDSSKLPKIDTGEAQFAASNTCIDAINGTIWIATGGKNSHIIKSSDYGETWNLIDIDFIKNETMTGIFSIDFYDNKNGFAFGGNWNDMENSTKNRFYTKDGGESWQEAKNNVDVGYRSCVQYSSEKNTIVALGIPGISISKNGGLSWQNISDEKDFYTFRFVDDNTVWAAGKGKLARIKL